MSNMRTSIKCNCGQRIIAKDVVQHGYYLRLFGPSFVYVKFRCSRCKKLGEQFIKQEEWEDGILKDVVLEVAPEEKELLTARGPIDINEVIDFHFELDALNDLKSLELAPPPPKKSKTRSTRSHSRRRVKQSDNEQGHGISRVPVLMQGFQTLL